MEKDVSRNNTEPRVKKTDESKEQISSFFLVAGVYKSKEAALAEANILKLRDIPALVEARGTHYRVIVGQYTSMETAMSALRYYEAKGFQFVIKQAD
jgi:cell division protein FtsN